MPRSCNRSSSWVWREGAIREGSPGQPIHNPPDRWWQPRSPVASPPDASDSDRRSSASDAVIGRRLETIRTRAVGTREPHHHACKGGAAAPLARGSTGAQPCDECVDCRPVALRIGGPVVVVIATGDGQKLLWLRKRREQRPAVRERNH